MQFISNSIKYFVGINKNGINNVNVVVALAAAFVCTSSLSQPVRVASSDGSEMKISLGAGIVVNKNSTARKTMHKVIDDKSPVKLVGDQRFDVEFKTGRGSSGEYVYLARAIPATEKDMVAVEVLHVVFDIFGRHIRTLQDVAVADVSAGNSLYHENAGWRISSEAEAGMAHTVFSFVSSAKFKDGTVYSAPIPIILSAIKKMAPAATEEQIYPLKSK